MDEEALEIGEPVVVGDVVIRPIAYRRLAGGTDGTATGAIGLLRPMGVIVEGPDGVETLDLSGEELADDVLADLPDVDLEA